MFDWFQSASRKRIVLPAVVAVLVGGALAFWLFVRPWLFQESGESGPGAEGSAAAASSGPPLASQSGAIAEMGLQTLLAQEANPKADVDRLRADLLTFSRQQAGLPQALKATEVVMRLPSPLDQLDRKKIPAEELALAGGGDPGRAPAGLVAILRAGPSPGRGASEKPSPGVRSLAFSGDGSLLATGGDDQRVRIWDTSTGRELHATPPQGAPVNAVAFAAGNGLVASAAEDGTIKLWQADTGEELQGVAGGQGKSVSLAFNPNGRVLAWGNDQAILTLWDTETGKQRYFRRASSRTGPAVVAFSSDGRVVASGAADGEVRLWEALTGGQLLVVRGPGSKSPITAIALSPDQQLVAATDVGSGVKLWQADSGRPVEGLKAQAAPGSCLAFRPDGRVLGFAGTDGTIHLWDVAAEKEAGRIPLGPGAGVPRQWAFSPDGRYLAVAHDGGAVYIFRLAAPPGKADGNQSGSPKEKK